MTVKDEEEEEAPGKEEAPPDTYNKNENVAAAAAVPSRAVPKQPSALPPKGLQTQGVISFRIPTDNQAAAHIKEHHGTNGWEHKCMKILHSKKVQIFLAALLALDVLILFTEMALHASYPACHIIKRDAISCCPITTSDEEEDSRTRLLASSSDDDDHHGITCMDGLQPSPSYPAECDGHKWHRVHTAEDVLFFITIAILTIFFVEINVTMIALRPKVFFRHAFYALDYLVITVSLVLESVFHALHNDLVQSYAGIVIIIRCWRFVRIGHGIIEITAEVAHKKYETLLSYTEELESILAEHRLALPEASFRVDRSSTLLDVIEQHHREKFREKRFHSGHSSGAHSG